MKLIRKKSTSFFLLLISVLLIWSIIFWKIYSHYSGDQNDEINIEHTLSDTIYNTNESLKEPDEQIPYVKLDRDPFTFKRQKKIIKTKKNKELPIPPVQKEQINYSIKGVIINNSSKMLILHDETNNETVFLREGEKYKYITIKKIKQSIITLSEYQEVKSHKINSQ